MNKPQDAIVRSHRKENYDRILAVCAHASMPRLPCSRDWQKSYITWKEGEGPCDDLISVQSVRIVDGAGAFKDAFSIHEQIQIEVVYEIKKEGYKFNLVLVLRDSQGTPLFYTVDTTNELWHDRIRESGWYQSSCVIPKDFLTNGEVTVSLRISVQGTSPRINEENVVSFFLSDDMQSTGARGGYVGKWPYSAVRPTLKWNIEYQKCSKGSI